MKKLILLIVLVMALVGGAYFTRPSDNSQSFTDYLVKHGRSQAEAQTTAATCQYTDRMFWVSARQDDRIVGTCIFGHWVNHGEIKHAVQQGEQALTNARK
jgi:hypothetical protein